MTSNYSFGIPPGGFVPTGALDSILPYLTYGPNTALSLTQLQNQRDIADRQAWASVFGDQIRAGATVQAAAAAADAQIQSQRIQTGGMLQATQGQLANQANISNQGTAMQLAQMAGSGQLRDAIANRLALRGFGAMPAIGSALNGVNDRIWVNAPNIGGAPGGGGGTSGGASSSGGGSFGYSGGSMPQGGGNIADTFNGIYRGIQPSLQFGNVFGNGGGTSGSAPVTPSYASAPAPTAADPPWYKALFPSYDRDRTGVLDSDQQRAIDNSVRLRLLTASHGGTFGPGKSVLVGEAGPEIMTIRSGQSTVTPLVGQAATGGTFGTTEPYPGYDSNKEYNFLRQQALGNDPLSHSVGLAGPSTGAGVTGGPQPVVRSAGSIGQTEPYPGYNSNKEYNFLRRQALAARPQPYLDPQYSAPNIGNYSTAAGPSYDPSMTAGEFQAARTGIAQNGSDYAKKVFGALGGPGLTGGGSKPLGPLPPQPIGSGGGMLPLFDVNQIPAFQMLRSGQVWPSFGMGPQSFSEPSLGISSLPGPESSASTFRRMSPYDQQDALQGWEFLGMPQQVAVNRMQAVTPGFRFQPARTFGY